MTARQENGKAAFDVEGVVYTEGQRASVLASFHGRSRRRVVGALIVVTKDEAFVETAFGPVAGPVATLEPEE